MPPPAVVKHLDIIDDITACVITGRIDMSLNSFTLEQLKEAFCNSIIVTVPATAHTGFQLVLLQKSLAVMTGILTALIGVTKVIGAAKLLKSLSFLIKTLQDIIRKDGKADTKALRKSFKSVRTLVRTNIG